MIAKLFIILLYNSQFRTIINNCLYQNKMCNESNFICLHSDQYNKCLDQNLNYNNLTNMFNSDMFNTNTFNTSWYKMNLNFSSDTKIDRDNNCGNCLRGTEFTPDSKYILVGKMGGNGIAIIDIAKRKYLGTVTGMKTNMRHLVIKDSMLYLSSNKYGYVQKTLLYDFVNYFSTTSKMGAYNKWQNAFVGIGTNVQEYDAVSKSGSDFIVPFLINVGNTKNQGGGYSYWKKKINSAYGSAEFGFQDWAFLTVTARNDWFSTLSLKDKVAPNNDLYTSASLSLVLSDVMDLGDTVSFLKLRGGYSQVAGGADTPYALSLSYGIYGQGHLGASLGNISGGTIPNSEITPFEKNETEFGVDLRMFDNKLSIDATYYDNETLGDIVGVSASATSGFGSALANLGNISNSGIELLIKGEIMRTDDFAWNASINYTNNTSEVVATNDTGGNISMDEPRSRNLRVTHIVGEKYGALYGSSYVRNDAGAIVHEMVNGIPIPKIGARKILGFGVAPTALGFGSSFRYKDFNASILVEGKTGGQIYSGTNAFLIRNGHHKKTVPAGGREAGFTPSGVMEDGSSITTSIPQAQQEDYYRRTYSIAEEAIQDSDYMRVRQLSIGYNVPSSMLEGTFVDKATVSLIGRNLFFLSNSTDNIDPESAYNNGNSAGLEWFGLPVPRTIGLNVNLKF